MSDIPTLMYDGVETLPLYLIKIQLITNLPAFGTGKGRVIAPSQEDLDYLFPIIPIPEQRALRAPAAAQALGAWEDYLHKYCVRSQFVDDKNADRYAALYEQTELLSKYLEAEHSVDTTVLLESIRLASDFANVHFAYRADKNRDAKRDEYVRRLESTYARFSEKRQAAALFVKRMQLRLTAEISGIRKDAESSDELTRTATPTSIDFVLVTALDEERDAILRLWSAAKPVPPSERDVRFYYEGPIEGTFPDGGKCKYNAVLVSLLSMGRVSAAR